MAVNNWLTWLYALLLFCGLSFASIGISVSEVALTISGIVFILLVPFATQSWISSQARSLTLALMALGTTAGYILSRIGCPFPPEVTGYIASAVGGVAFGRIIFPELGELKIIIKFLPKPFKWTYFIVEMIYSLIWAVTGITLLKDFLGKLYGPTSGSIVIGGFTGVIVGFLILWLRKQSEQPIAYERYN